MRPQSIVRFEQAYLASVLVGLINLVVSWDTKLSTMARDPRFANPQMAQTGELMMIGVAAFGLIVSLLLWYFAARRGSEVAKWILVIFLLFSAFGVLSALVQLAAVGTLSVALTVLAFALNACAVWMLFQPDAVAWMRGPSEANADPLDPGER